MAGLILRKDRSVTAAAQLMIDAVRQIAAVRGNA